MIYVARKKQARKLLNEPVVVLEKISGREEEGCLLFGYYDGEEFHEKRFDGENREGTNLGYYVLRENKKPLRLFLKDIEINRGYITVGKLNTSPSREQKSLEKRHSSLYGIFEEAVV